MNKRGRPLKFKTVKILQNKIVQYFKNTPKEEWTITGLALALDTSRKVLCEYEENDDFSNTIKKAKLMVENGYEIDLKKYGRSGTIFALKNFDWKDKTEIGLDDNIKGLANLLNNEDKRKSKEDADGVPEEDKGGTKVVRDNSPEEKVMGEGGGDTPSPPG